ncbi:MAG: hypothetical protein HYZ53_08000 [Planctomycetes bacterium]|nr:hypothetical protein [Planctomycetota bacterium]
MAASPARIVHDEDPPALAPATAVGGKAANLARLREAGSAVRAGGTAAAAGAAGAGVPIAVPPWFCVTTRVFEDLALALRADLDPILARIDPADPRAAVEASEAVRALFRRTRLPLDDERELLAAFDRRFRPGTLVAVRSSAVGEDAGGNSFAGQLDTHLFVRREDVLDRLKDVLASAYSARSVAYRRARGEEGPPVRAAVVVQEMVDGRVSGVLFTADPTSGDASTAVLSAGYGLGEGIVADKVETDTFFVARATGRMTRRVIARKTVQVVRNEDGGGTRTAPVPEARAAAPCLADAQVAALVALGAELERLFGCPQDIEWTIDDAGRIFVTQARPITTLRDERERLFDNANIIEGYPGVTTPLTFSFVRFGYEILFRQVAYALGIPKTVVAREHALFANMVGFLDGRIYYSLLNWYRFQSFFPGYEKRLPTWEKSLGLRIRPSLSASAAPSPGGLVAWTRYFYVLVRHTLLIDRDVRRFHERFDRVRAAYRRRPLERMSADGLLELYEELVRDLLHHWEVTIVNDIFAFRYYELAGKLVDRWFGAEGAGLRDRLLCGVAGMESVEPARSLVALAERVRGDAALARLFAEEKDDAAVWSAVGSDARFGEFRAAFREHVERYGDRTVRELTLETPGAEENPAYLLRLLRNFLEGGQTVRGMVGREDETRREAEATAERLLKGRPVRRRLFRYALGRARATLRHRENMRLARSRAFGMVKRIFRAMGRLFAERGLLEKAEDIFYLGVDEIAGYVRGASICRSLSRLVALRREEFARYAAAPAPPSRVQARGIVYGCASETGTVAGPGAAVAGDGPLLQGIGCSPGIVRAPAKVVLDPTVDTAVVGRILVARMTDPGWVFLMTAAKGLVVERGSPLSHTAIIGRELGIPTVVAVEGATARIVDGQELEIDGQRGTVRIVISGESGAALLPGHS